jgi:hypothetical protein
MILKNFCLSIIEICSVCIRRSLLLVKVIEYEFVPSFVNPANHLISKNIPRSTDLTKKDYNKNEVWDDDDVEQFDIVLFLYLKQYLKEKSIVLALKLKKCI